MFKTQVKLKVQIPMYHYLLEVYCQKTHKSKISRKNRNLSTHLIDQIMFNYNWL